MVYIGYLAVPVVLLFLSNKSTKCNKNITLIFYYKKKHHKKKTALNKAVFFLSFMLINVLLNNNTFKRFE